MPPRTNPCSYLIATAAMMGMLAGGCTKNDQPENLTGEPSGRLLVFAAASLTDAFDELAKGFRARHPEVDLKLNYAGSQSLRTQIEQGAQPQVFASANKQHLESLHERGLVSAPRDFAINEMVIVVPASNPAKIRSLSDLPKAERLVLAGRAVPAGAYAERVLEKADTTLGADFAARVRKRVVSREMHVRQTLQKVVLGEADAAMVYATDAAAAGSKISAIEIPSELNVRATYPIATVEDSPNQRVARLFVEYVASDRGRAILETYGFRTPERLAAIPAEVQSIASIPGGK